jgi:hypothetical protein
MLDKIKCKLGIHDWVKTIQEFQINFVLPDSRPVVSMTGLTHLSSSFPPANIDFLVRVCSKCHKKQRKSALLDPTSNPKSKFGLSKWVDAPLNLEEKRDRILNEILK